MSYKEDIEIIKNESNNLINNILTILSSLRAVKEDLEANKIVLSYETIENISFFYKGLIKLDILLNIYAESYEERELKKACNETIDLIKKIIILDNKNIGSLINEFYNSLEFSTTKNIKQYLTPFDISYYEKDIG